MLMEIYEQKACNRGVILLHPGGIPHEYTTAKWIKAYQIEGNKGTSKL